MCCVLVVMVTVQSPGVPSQLNTEYRARAGGMREHTTVAGSRHETREASTQGLKFAKNLNNAEKMRKQNRHFEELAERILE